MAISQNEQVKRYIEKHGSIDTYRAMKDLNIFRLSARIKNLKDLGYPIISTMKERTLEDGSVKRWAEYTISHEYTANQGI